MTFTPQTPPELEADTITFLNDLAQFHRSSLSAGDAAHAPLYRCQECEAAGPSLQELPHHEACLVGKAYALLRRYQQRSLEEAQQPGPCCSKQQEHAFMPIAFPLSHVEYPVQALPKLLAVCTRCLATYQFHPLERAWQPITRQAQERTP